MPRSARRAVRLAAAAALLPLLASAGALAQPRAPAPPAPRVVVPDVQLPGEAAAPTAAPAKPAAPAAQMSEGVAAIVNDDIISTYDMRQRMKLLVMTSGMKPTEQNLPQIEQEALRSLIDERLENQEIERVAKKQKERSFIADDKDVDEEISDIAKQNKLSYAQMKSAFAAQGLDIQTLREQMRTQITWRTLVRGVYGHNIRIGDDQVNNAVQRMSNQASQTQYLMAEIFIDATRAGGEQQAINGANQLIAQMQKGAPFEAVARQFSASPTAANGGDTGWITASETQPEVAKVVEQLRPGQMSQPIPVSDGVYIVYLRDKQAASGQLMVSLKQAAVRLDKDATPEQLAAAETSLKAIRPQIKGCDNIEQVAGKTPGVISADLGEAEINDLRGPFKDAAEKLQAGQVSEPIRTPVGLHLVAVCAKHTGGTKIPSRSEISNRLEADQLAVMSKRYLRDLRNSATIEAR
jgi:peptidyl-prolyl cis-trans isomerase SurA